MDMEVYTISDLQELADAQYDWSASAKDELITFNIMREFVALNKRLKASGGFTNKPYEHARHNLLRYVMYCAFADPVNGDHSNDLTQKLLTEAGHLLYQEGGMRSMHDGLVWSFIPKRYHQDINLAWNGIGEWKA